MKLSAAFPHAGAVNRAWIHQRLKDIQRLRSRLSHHERILTTSHKIYTGSGFVTLPEIIESAEWICTETAAWLKARFRYSTATRVLGGAAGPGVHLTC